MNVREVLYNNFNLELPTSKPLWTPKEGLQAVQPPLGNIETAQQKRLDLFNSMQINTNIVDLKGRILVANIPRKVAEIANEITSERKRYENIAHYFPNPIKWFHIGLLHQMECSLNFHCYLGNGQPYYKKTTKVPKGRGAFKSFEAGCIDAIKLDGLNNIQDWSIGNTLYVLELFNGAGYEKYHNTHSPYIWSGSNWYTSGYYIADSVYSTTTVSQQIGIGLIFKKLVESGVTTP